MDNNNAIILKTPNASCSTIAPKVTGIISDNLDAALLIPTPIFDEE
jgi:hypothetical protein